MRAAVLKGVGQALYLESVPDPQPGPGDAIVRLSAAALNHRDVWIRKGQYAGLKFPIILGSDGVGTVAEVGDGVDHAWIGREVIMDAALDWGPSEVAKSPTFRILGLPDDGTFAELVKIPASNLHAKPEHMSGHEAAALPLAGLTAFRALFTRGGLKAGEKLLVTGVGGGAGSFALQFGVAAGAEVYVTSGSPEKIEAAYAMGAKAGVNYRLYDWDKELEKLEGGFDLIVDSAGGDGFLQLCDLAKPGGRIVFFGATVGNPPELPMRKIFWSQLTLLGTTMGSPADFAAMLEFVSRHELRPKVDSVFSLSEANQAFDRMEAGDQFGKIVLEIATL